MDFNFDNWHKLASVFIFAFACQRFKFYFISRVLFSEDFINQTIRDVWDMTRKIPCLCRTSIDVDADFDWLCRSESRL